MMKDHPALDTVLWSHTPDGRIESAEYRGHKLIVRHTIPLESDNHYGLCLGFVDGRYIGSATNMPRVCNKIFAHVDQLEARRTRKPNTGGQP